MATQETQQLDQIIASRRALLTGGAALAATALVTAATGKAVAQSTTVTDNDILNFALNLEYLEANFYTLAASGQTISQAGLGVGAGTATTGGGTVTTKGSNNYASCKVPFVNPLVNAFALETATEERNHVTFLRGALGSAAVAQPNIDLYTPFVALGTMVGVGGFDPFANDAYFLLAAYIFEDVGVSAYHGAAPLISNKSGVLAPAVGIHAVEAYHAGMIRETIYSLDPSNTLGYLTLTQKISQARATLDGTGSASTPDDVGITITNNVALNGSSANYNVVTLVDADANSVGWARTTSQVLKIVYAGGAAGTGGGFFPNALNGTIK